MLASGSTQDGACVAAVFRFRHVARLEALGPTLSVAPLEIVIFRIALVRVHRIARCRIGNG